MRLFVAVLPPQGALAELEAAVAPLRPAWPDLRWAGQDRWHLTLAFLGEQPEARVTQVSLDDSGLARELRLAPKRLQLPAELGGEVDQPCHVRLHRFELAQRFLLAPAVLENAGRFLDQRPARLGTGVEDVV